MSQGQALSAADALVAAERFVEALRPSCDRIEIAGSLRRGKPYVHDIEVVAIAKVVEEPSGDLWETSQPVDHLEGAIGRALRAGFVAARDVDSHRADGRVETLTKLGPAFKALVFRGIPVDLFIVRPPATWGCIFALRTGPGDWNTKLVTECKTIDRRVAGGQVERWSGVHGWVAVPTPEEADFFAALGQPWVEPADRRVERVRVQRDIADVVAGV